MCECGKQKRSKNKGKNIANRLFISPLQLFFGGIIPVPGEEVVSGKICPKCFVVGFKNGIDALTESCRYN